MEANKLLASVFFGLVLGASAETNALSENEDPRVRYGGDFRFRIIHEDKRKLSSEETGNDRLWQRYRARIWSSVDLASNIQFNMRLVTEPRHYSHSSPKEDWIRKEILFDNFNLKFQNCFRLPLEVTAGRQQIEFADRWLVGEGTPDDGTRTAHFDAVRSRWEWEAQRATINLIWIENHRNSAAWLPPICDADLDNHPQDERGVIAWLSKEVSDGKFADSYFIYKKDFNGEGTVDSVNGETYTFGMRAHGKTDGLLSYNAEIAPQFGYKNSKDYSAFAANTWLQWTQFDPRGVSFRLGYEYLSGDSDPDKSFDKLWGREGLWSDLYTGGIDGFDGRSLDSSNLHRPHCILEARPFEKIRAKVEYSLLFADKVVDGVGSKEVDDGSRFRGHHLKAALEHQWTDRTKHYVTMQIMLPGNYYSDSREDTATWFRYGVEIEF